MNGDSRIIFRLRYIFRVQSEGTEGNRWIRQSLTLSPVDMHVLTGEGGPNGLIILY